MEDAEKILVEISNLWGLDIIWKRIGRWMPECGLSQKHTLHCCNFCQKVKSVPQRLNSCSANDNVDLLQLAKQKGSPFIHRCHAGVYEYVLPFFDHGEEVEVLLLGIFRQSPQDLCPYPELQAEFDELPVCPPEKFDLANSLLPPLLKLLRERREYLKTKDLCSHINDQRISECVLYLEKNFKRKLSVRQLAERYFLSASRFQHLFKTETGMSLSEYLLRLRLENAAGLLRNTGMLLGEIAVESGIPDQSRMGRLFRKYYNITPLNYRKQHRDT